MGTLTDDMKRVVREQRLAFVAQEVVSIKVERALPVTSPACDLGLSEAEIRARWERHHEALKRGAEGSTGG